MEAIGNNGMENKEMAGKERKEEKRKEKWREDGGSSEHVERERGKKEKNKKGPELLLQNYLGGTNPISIMNCMKYYVESLLKIHT